MFDSLRLVLPSSCPNVTTPKVQLLVFDGCPLADAAKQALDEAAAALNLGSYEVIDILDPETPETLKRWASPTILVNGRDVTGGVAGDSVGCRVYGGPDRVPDTETIISCIRRERARCD